MTGTVEHLPTVLTKFGRHSLSYAAWQPCCRQWSSPDGNAIVSYRITASRPVVLGDPLCSAQTAESVIDAFLAEYPKAVFLQSSEAVADILRHKGYRVACLGIETHLDLSTWKVDGRKQRPIRRNFYRARDAGLTAQEVEWPARSLSAEFDELETEWISTRQNQHPLEFLTPPRQMFMEDPRVRVVTVRDSEKRLVGYVMFTPIFEGGRIHGYNTTIVRHKPDAPRGTMVMALVTMIDAFRTEGVAILSLGLCPFSGDGTIPVSPWLRLVFSMLYYCGDRLYRFSGQAKHKNDWHGHAVPTYFATRGQTGLVDLWRGFKACGIL